MAERTWDQKYAFYAASLFRLGLFVDAGLVSAIMFERYIEDEFSAYPDLEKANKDFLKDAIEKLSRKNPIKYNYAILDELRKIRNKEIIHPKRIFNGLSSPKQKKEIKDRISKITRFVWKVIDPETFNLYGSLSEIPFLVADYAVMEIKELLQQDMSTEDGDRSKTIKTIDFENLFLMRNKIMNFARYAKERLLCKFKNIDVDVISRVDTTSAYVWLAMNFHKNSDDGLRNRISGASASILATPIDLRVYLDFGGEATDDRIDYYQFLMSFECQEFFDGYVDDELVMFDIDWYSFAFNKKLAKNILVESVKQELINAETKLSKCLEDEIIISWNRNLLGYFIDRREIGFSEIVDKLERIIKLYYYFEKYRIGILGRKAEFPWIPSNEYLLISENSLLNNYKFE